MVSELSISAPAIQSDHSAVNCPESTQPQTARPSSPTGRPDTRHLITPNAIVIPLRGTSFGHEDANPVGTVCRLVIHARDG